MKKAIALLLCVLLLLPTAFTAQAEAPSGTLKMLAYNVSGIPVVGRLFCWQETRTAAARAVRKRKCCFITVMDND